MVLEPGRALVTNKKSISYFYRFYNNRTFSNTIHTTENVAFPVHGEWQAKSQIFL
jgi:hypothetical protein